MRLFYSILFYCFLPFILLRLYWRGFKAPAYRSRWTERLGFYTDKSAQNLIWFHAVSVGEAEAAFPLIKQFMLESPESKILITTTTPTGSARVKAVMGEAVEHVYLPYDISFAIKRFLKHFKPQKAIIMETEIWPNLFALIAQQNIPLFIINARLSEKSCKGYQKLPALVHPALAAVTLIATQSEADTQRFKKIAANDLNIQTTGNIKFDLQLENNVIEQGKQLKNTLFKNRFVWIIASTHKGEEAIFFDIYPELKKQIPELLLLIVPRHPERFDEVESLAKAKKLTITRRTINTQNVNTDIYLADTMGELKMLYAAADIAFVGGSLLTHLGGHNVLEPAAAGIPVMFGSYMSNFKAIENGILSAQAAIQCQSPLEISEQLAALYTHSKSRQTLIDNAFDFLGKNKGATAKTLKLLQ